MDKDDRRITSYLVGELPETEQAELERQYFGDPTLVDRVIQVETQLLDAYARGRLSDDMRRRVARQYLAHPTRRERLKFAEALAAKLDDLDPAVLQGQGPRSWWHGAWVGPGRAVRLSMAVATSLLMVTASWLYVERIRLREELNRVQATRDQRERDLQQQLTTERLNGAAAIAERDRLLGQQPSPTDAAGPARSRPAVVSLLFVIGGVRGPDDLPRALKIPPGTEQVRLQLNLKENDYPRYGIAVQAVGGTDVLSRQGLLPEKTESGWLLALSAPASRFAPGDYVLTLSGVTRDGDRDEVSKSIFRVEK